MGTKTRKKRRKHAMEREAQRAAEVAADVKRKESPHSDSLPKEREPSGCAPRADFHGDETTGRTERERGLNENEPRSDHLVPSPRGDAWKPQRRQREGFTKRGTPCAKSWTDAWIAQVDAIEADLGRRICGASSTGDKPCKLASDHPSGRCGHHGGVRTTRAPEGNPFGAFLSHRVKC